VVIFDATMREMRRVAVPDRVKGICVSADRMYVSSLDQRIVGYDVATFDMVCEHRVGDDDAVGDYRCMVVSDGVLFSAEFDSDEDQFFYGVVTFDALTLQVRSHFGHDHIEGVVRAMAVAGSELFVIDERAGRIQVYSTSSLLHLREIRGDWGSPEDLLYNDGRLYVSLHDDSGSDLRISVLTLDGQILQTWKDQNYCNAIEFVCLFGPRLIVNVQDCERANRKLISLMGI